MTRDIATRLRTLYDSLTISLNFIVNEIKRVFMKEFFDTATAASETISSVTYNSYTIKAGKIYDIDLDNVTNPLFNLTTEEALLTAECPEWHFFFTAGSDSPAWAKALSSITISWASTPSWTAGTRYEINIIFVNNGNNSTYEGLFMEQEAAS